MAKITKPKAKQATRSFTISPETQRKLTAIQSFLGLTSQSATIQHSLNLMYDACMDKAKRDEKYPLGSRIMGDD